jgi:pimeloyl-ACP methyl ester carboxylesterase
MVMTFFLTFWSGFFVIAPNLLGHAGRRGSDYRMSALAEDLQPYLVINTYDVIIGFSLGGTVALSLLPLLPKEKETTVILVDPPLEVPKRSEIERNMIMDEIMRVKTVDELITDNPAWSRVDCVIKMLGLSMCDRTVVESIFQVKFQV